MFVIEDRTHSDWMGEFQTIGEAISELSRLRTIAWDEPPNRCPCSRWKTCRRDYDLIEFGTASTPWHPLRRVPALSVSSAGATWLLPDGQSPA